MSFLCRLVPVQFWLLWRHDTLRCLVSASCTPTRGSGTEFTPPHFFRERSSVFLQLPLSVAISLLPTLGQNQE